MKGAPHPGDSSGWAHCFLGATGAAPAILAESPELSRELQGDWGREQPTCRFPPARPSVSGVTTASPWPGPVLPTARGHRTRTAEYVPVPQPSGERGVGDRAT